MPFLLCRWLSAFCRQTHLPGAKPLDPTGITKPPGVWSPKIPYIILCPKSGAKSLKEAYNYGHIDT